MQMENLTSLVAPAGIARAEKFQWIAKSLLSLINTDEIMLYYNETRVEFRSVDIRLTDFEIAAFAVFIILVTYAVSYQGLFHYR